MGKNWHWKDKNCIEFAKKYFNSALLKSFNLKTETTQPNTSNHANANHEIDLNTKLNADVDQEFVVLVTEVKTTGDCDLNQRKGKMIHFFDLSLNLKFKYNQQSGSIEIPEFMHDTITKDLVVNINYDKEMSQALKKELIKQIRDTFTLFSHDLMSEHGKDLLDGEVVESVNQKYSPKPIIHFVEESQKTKAAGSLITIEQNIEFQCTAADLYETLMDSKRVSVWSRSESKISKVIGSEYSLFGGNITGRVVELVKDVKIVLKWRVKTWPSEHFSDVVITLLQEKDCTRLKLVQSLVPVGEKSATEGNWDNYYWNSIKRTFGYGTLL